MSGFRSTYPASRLDLPDITLDAVGAFSGSIILRKTGGMVEARGGVSRATGSSTAYTDCVDAIPVGFRPTVDTAQPGAVFFGAGAPADSYQFLAQASGEFQVRMSGANANGMTVDMTWPAA